MNLKIVKTKLRSLRLNLSVHPETEPNSEFADRISDLNEIIEWIDSQDSCTPLDKLEEFQKAFGSTFSETPTLLQRKDWLLRVNLIQEELDEYRDACESEDLVEVLDANVDMAFLIFGTVVSHGLQHVFNKSFNEVHRSNMSKLGLDGKPIINGVNCELDPSKPFGKILKPIHYSKPDLKQFLLD